MLNPMYRLGELFAVDRLSEALGQIALRFAGWTTGHSKFAMWPERYLIVEEARQSCRVAS
jgi:hypothetical protein